MSKIGSLQSRRTYEYVLKLIARFTMPTKSMQSNINHRCYWTLKSKYIFPILLYLSSIICNTQYKLFVRSENLWRLNYRMFTFYNKLQKQICFCRCIIFYIYDFYEDLIIVCGRNPFRCIQINVTWYNPL